MKSTRTKAGQLGSYLTLTVGAGTVAGTVEAAIVNLDIGPSGLNIAGVNAGLVSPASRQVAFPGGGVLDLLFNSTYQGLDGESGLLFAVNGGDPSPRNFGIGQTIGSSVPTWRGERSKTVFVYETALSPAFGSGSFMGFKSANGNYGWLEVTWDSTQREFEILSGAYEDVAGVAIQAGAVAVVPEPASALGTLGLLSAGMFLRRRQRAA